ncbi:uncharacterized protein TRIADDRAFT_53854 [Trichoplax adhaerens]|uniref:Uncharacterized protein n=1 Tax=Trichoplax adhaerens TaxID=10228 RepID=B3RQC3_TRIAD|nr:hypothetical protein TRIADDRAFT_53854 [Trichoplax adhaerens]EDV27806.1 hypothetical protein TRIADDRAFT_53854 [Trichoplax adhaerens]|eukprot:XP_002109640.1 hypothetical protein TRIADDRAFT_53854 [Trichoplax adhaerens]
MFFKYRINWKETPLVKIFGGQIEVAFILIASIGIVVILIATTSYAEVPYTIIGSTDVLIHKSSSRKSSDDLNMFAKDCKTYSSIQSTVIQKDQMEITDNLTDDKLQAITAKEISNWNHLYQTYYFTKTMPKELLILWIASFFSWLSYNSFAYFLTDFVGQSIYHGNPLAAENSTALHRYDRGVSAGSWGFLGCTVVSVVYSLTLGRITKYIAFKYNKLVIFAGADRLLLIGYSIASIATLIMVLTNQVIVVLCMAALQGFGFASTFTLPYAILASYHNYFTKTKDKRWNFRELGLDISLLFVSANLACIITGCCLSVIIALVESSKVAMIFSSVSSGLCAVTCIFIIRVPNNT